MKWYEWLLVLACIFLSNVGTLYFAKEYLFKPRVVDLLALGLYTQKDVYERILAGEDPRKLEQEVLQKTKLLEQYLRENRRGLVLIKQCVLAGEVEDITNEVVSFINRR